MPPASIPDLEKLFGQGLSVVLTVAGIASLIMILVGGYSLLSSGGEKEPVQKARNTITFAVAGLILAISGWLILNLVGNFLGIDFSVFNICVPGQTSTSFGSVLNCWL